MFYEVSDFHRSVEFYRDVLGLKLTMLHDSGEFQWAEFDLVQTTLGICPVMGEGRTEPRPGGTIYVSVDDVGESIKELAAKGVRVVFGPYESPVCVMGMVLDPDGNSIGLHYRKDGTVG